MLMLNEQLQQLKKSLDGSYTELKRAQDALTKALKHKKDTLNLRLNKNN